jgi:hypothetical protein
MIVLCGLDSYVIRQRRSADGSGFRLGLDYVAAAHNSCAFPARSSAERQAVLLQLVSWTALAEHRDVLGARPKNRQQTLDVTLLYVNYSNRMPFVLPPISRDSPSGCSREMTAEVNCSALNGVIEHPLPRCSRSLWKLTKHRD